MSQSGTLEQPRSFTNGLVVPFIHTQHSVVDVHQWFAVIQTILTLPDGLAGSVIAAHRRFQQLNTSVVWIEMGPGGNRLLVQQAAAYFANASDNALTLENLYRTIGFPMQIVMQLFGAKVLPPINWALLQQQFAHARGKLTIGRAWDLYINPQNRFRLYFARSEQRVYDIYPELPDLLHKSSTLAVARLLTILQGRLDMPDDLKRYLVFPSQRARTDMHFIERILRRPFLPLPMPPGSTAAMFPHPNSFLAPNSQSSLRIDERLMESGTTVMLQAQAGESMYIPVLRYIGELITAEEQKSCSSDVALIEMSPFFDFASNFGSLRPASSTCEDAFCGTFSYYDGDSPFLLRVANSMITRNKFTAAVALSRYPNLSTRVPHSEIEALRDAIANFKITQWEEAIRWKMIPFNSVAELEAMQLDDSYYRRADLAQVNAFVAPFEHSMDQPICRVARLLGIQAVVLTSMADVETDIQGLVTEVLDTRSKLESYGSIHVDRRYLDPSHPTRTEYDRPAVGVQFDYPAAFALSPRNTGRRPSLHTVSVVPAPGRAYMVSPFPQSLPTAQQQQPEPQPSEAEIAAFMRAFEGVGSEDDEELLQSELEEKYQAQLPHALAAILGQGQRPIFATTVKGLEGTLEFKFGSAPDFITRELQLKFGPSPKRPMSLPPKNTNMFILKTINVKPKYQRTGVFSKLMQVICAYASVDVVLIESITNPGWMASMVASGRYWAAPGNPNTLYFQCQQ